jgi:hypothetical protein
MKTNLLICFESKAKKDKNLQVLGLGERIILK